MEREARDPARCGAARCGAARCGAARCGAAQPLESLRLSPVQATARITEHPKYPTAECLPRHAPPRTLMRSLGHGALEPLAPWAPWDPNREWSVLGTSVPFACEQGISLVDAGAISEDVN